MKKLLSILLITSFSLIGYAQERVLDQNIFFKQFSTPTVNDSIATINAEGQIGLIPKSDLLNSVESNVSATKGISINQVTGAVELGGNIPAFESVNIGLGGTDIEDTASLIIESNVNGEDTSTRFNKEGIFSNAENLVVNSRDNIDLKGNEVKVDSDFKTEIISNQEVSIVSPSVSIGSGENKIDINSTGFSIGSENNTPSGLNSLTVGSELTAGSFSEVAVGYANTTPVVNDANAFHRLDRAFSVGIGRIDEIDEDEDGNPIFGLEKYDGLIVRKDGAVIAPLNYNRLPNIGQQLTTNNMVNSRLNSYVSFSNILTKTRTWNQSQSNYNIDFVNDYNIDSDTGSFNLDTGEITIETDELSILNPLGIADFRFGSSIKFGGINSFFTSSTNTNANRMFFTDNSNIGMGIEYDKVVNTPFFPNYGENFTDGSLIHRKYADNRYVKKENDGLLQINTDSQIRLNANLGLRIPYLDSDPIGAGNGAIYYNNSTGKLRLRAPGGWVSLN